MQTNTCSRCPAHTGWVAGRLGPEKWRPPAWGSAPRPDCPGRTSRRLNHHGQLTGFPRPERSRSRTPREPLERLISTRWRDAMFFTVYTPRDRQLRPLINYIYTEWASRINNLSLCPHIRPFKVPPDSKNPTERLGRELCSTSLRFLPGARAVPLPALALQIVLNEIKQTGSRVPGARSRTDAREAGPGTASRGGSRRRGRACTPLWGPALDADGSGVGYSCPTLCPPPPVGTYCHCPPGSDVKFESSIAQEGGGRGPCQGALRWYLRPCARDTLFPTLTSPRPPPRPAAGSRALLGGGSVSITRAKPRSQPRGIGARRPGCYRREQKDSVRPSESRC